MQIYFFDMHAGYAGFLFYTCFFFSFSVNHVRYYWSLWHCTKILKLLWGLRAIYLYSNMAVQVERPYGPKLGVLRSVFLFLIRFFLIARLVGIESVLLLYYIKLLTCGEGWGWYIYTLEDTFILSNTNIFFL